MTFPETLSVILLGLALVIAVWKRLNIGVLAFAAAFVLLLFVPGILSIIPIAVGL